MRATKGAVEIKKLARSVLFTLLALAVIAALLWFGDVNKVLAVIERFQPIYVLWFLLLLLAYEVVRAFLWSLLLQTLAAHVPLRTQVFAFAAGEAAKFVPTGAYLQNYVLQRSKGVDFGRTSAATTVIILGEIVVALLGLVILGVGDWSRWLRLAIIGGAVVVVGLVWAYRAVPHVMRAPAWVTRRTLLSRALEEFRRFRAGAAELLHARTVGITLLLSACYVLIAGAGLYLVVRALGIEGISFWQAQAVNCFGLAFYVVLGSLEAADVGVLMGLGMSKSAAVSIILVNRALSVAATLALTVIVMAVLRAEWRAVLAPRRGKGRRAARR